MTITFSEKTCPLYERFKISIETNQSYEDFFKKNGVFTFANKGPNLNLYCFADIADAKISNAQDFACSYAMHQSSKIVPFSGYDICSGVLIQTVNYF